MNDEQDFRDRYVLPEHFLRDENQLTGIYYYKRMNDIIKNLPKGKSVLDVGCGDGFFSGLLKEHGLKVTGIDYNKRGIAFARALNPDCTFIEDDLRTHEFKDKFDIATFICVLEHIAPEYHKLTLDKIHSAIKSKGKLVITIPSVFMKVHKYHYVHFTISDIINILSNSNFEAEKVIFHNKINPILKFFYNSKFEYLLHNPYYDLKFLRKIWGNIYRKYFSLSKGFNDYRLITVIAGKIKKQMN